MFRKTSHHTLPHSPRTRFHTPRKLPCLSTLIYVLPLAGLFISGLHSIPTFAAPVQTRWVDPGAAFVTLNLATRAQRTCKVGVPLISSLSSDNYFLTAADCFEESSTDVFDPQGNLVGELTRKSSAQSNLDLALIHLFTDNNPPLLSLTSTNSSRNTTPTTSSIPAITITSSLSEKVCMAGHTDTPKCGKTLKNGQKWPASTTGIHHTGTSIGITGATSDLGAPIYKPDRGFIGIVTAIDPRHHQILMCPLARIIAALQKDMHDSTLRIAAST